MNSKHLKVHVLRKLAEALRKLPAETKIRNLEEIHVLRKLAEGCGRFFAEAKIPDSKNLMCCGSLRKVAEGNLRKQIN